MTIRAPAAATATRHIRDALVTNRWFNQPAQFTRSAQAVLQKRYLAKDDLGNVTETPDDMFRRVAHNLSQADLLYGSSDAERQQTEQRFYDVMRNLQMLPNSPTLMNAGRELQQLAACFVLPVEDNLEDIFEKVKQTALIHQSGGGTGFSFSRLRPAGDRVRATGGVASGPVSFIEAFNAATESVKQGGTRRGANMGILHVTHPDILEFIAAKSDGQRLNNFNISVAVTEQFMKQVQAGENYDLVNPNGGAVTGQLNAREVFDRIVAAAWQTGDPGLIFIDRANADHPNPQLGLIESSNPCGEQIMLPNESCNLGSINLARMTRCETDRIVIDYDRMRGVIDTAVHLLDNVIDMNRYPIPQIEEMSKLTRRIGLGVMGWADLLIQLAIPYDSAEACALASELMGWIHQQTHAASQALADRREPYPAWKGSTYAVPMRNTSPTTIAPTGTISIIAGASSGIEPHYALYYVRNVMDGAQLVEINPYLKALGHHTGGHSAELLTERLASGESIHDQNVPQWVKDTFRVSHDIAPEWHVATQAAFQAHTDNAVSKTVNFPNHATRDDVAHAYQLAYELGCKGITVYRDGSKSNQVLSAGNAAAHDAAAAAASALRPPRGRPRRTTGVTDRVRTGHGNMYVTVNLDEHGQPFEVFGNMGKAGGCDAALLESLTRIVSLALRGGIPAPEITEQLRGITCCPAWDDGILVKSSPDAIALVLENLNAPNPEIQAGPAATSVPPPAPLGNTGFHTQCPECNGAISYQEGCQTCPRCAWSRC